MPIKSSTILFSLGKSQELENLLSKNRLIHLKPIMTFLGKSFETYPKIRLINHDYIMAG